MRPLYAPSRVAELLDHYSLSADKTFGQNFLIDGNALRDIVAAADIGPDDEVLEIGPGLGVLTRELAGSARSVIAVEADARLLPALAETLEGLTNIELVHQDALDFDYDRMPSGSLLVSNLPYSVATPILRRALASGRFRRLVFLVQKEVAERLVARPGSKAYGALSLIREHHARARVVRTVPPGCFLPAPEVTSSLVVLEPRPGVAEDPHLFALIRDAFRHRRKTLVRNLTLAGHPKTRVVTALDDLGIDPKIRAEALGLDRFQALSERLLSETHPGRGNRVY